MSHKKRASTALKSMGAAGLAAATIVSGLSFGALAATASPVQTDSFSTPLVFKAGNSYRAYTISGTEAFTTKFTATDYSTYSAAAARATSATFPDVGTTGYINVGSVGCLGLLYATSTFISADPAYCTTDNPVRWSVSRSGAVYSATVNKFAGGSVTDDGRTWAAPGSEATPLAGSRFEQVALTAQVTKVNNIAKSAEVSGTATPNGTVTIGSKVANVNSSGNWSMTVEGLSVGANSLTATQRFNNAQVDQKTVTATIVAGGTLVGVDQGPIELERGESTQVPFVVENREARTNTDGTVTLEAPEGTTFDEQTTVQGQWRQVGGTGWENSTSIPLTNGSPSSDGKTITFDVDWAANHGANEQYRFMVGVTAAGDAPAGSDAMDFSMPGTSSKGDFLAEGTTTTTIETNVVDLVANIASIDHAGKTAVISGTATPGATITIGDKRVEADAETGAWSITVDDLDRGTNPLHIVQEIDGEEHDSKDLDVVINDAAISGQDGTAVTLERGEVTSVESLFKTNGSISRPQGKVEFTAPEGTTFAADQGTIEGSFKKPGEDAWTNAAMTLTNGVRSEDGTKYTYDFATTTTTWNLPDASLMRWNINVSTPEDADAGTFPMRTVLSGTAVEGAFNTTSTTQATIGDAVNPVAPIVVETPANGSTATDKRPVFSGTGDEGATIEITGSTGRVVATTTVKDGKWSVPAGFDLVDGSYMLIATQTPLEGEKTSAPINFVVKAMVPVTLTAPAIGSDVSTPNPVFQGRGTPGATVVVKGTYGSVLATTEVKADGTWTVPSAIALATGSYAGTATQTVDGKTTTAPFRFTVGQTLAPVTLETPAIGAEVEDTKPVFTGTGQPGATIEVKGTYGTLLATAVVKDDGTWEAPSDITLANGQYAGKAWQTVNGKTTSADFRFTVVQAIAPVTLETPAIGAEVTDTKPVFTGEGQPGATVEVKGTYGTLLATAVVKDDGTWEAPSDITLANGQYAGKAWQTVNGKTTSADFRFTVVQAIAPVTLETPAIGAEVTDTKPLFTGEGQPGATVEVKGTYGTLLATAVVKDDGTWEAPSDVTLARGSYAGKAWQTVNGKTTSADFRFTVVAPMIPVSLTTPAQDAVVSTPNPVFSGKGTPDADITVTGASGTQLAAGKVRSNGEFDLTSTIALGAGSYSGTVRQVAGGKVTTAPFQFRIQFTAVTLESPAIGGTVTSGTPVFSGTGTPNAPLVIKGSGGTTLATGSVKNNGTWTLTSTVTLAPGSYSGTVLQSLPGADTTARFSFKVS
ncbi:Ig-like domain-containing protein [Curtobacterium flaccumfaciens]|uniref:Ig-like domain-containing protein n=1 Tax=Curtobacterium flaccumfaciens TaxID=2035 RepID=UPI003B0013AE